MLNEGKVFADLHIHSRFSRACSKDITLANLEKWARVKGINLLGTGDFQHQKWFTELNELEERDELAYSRTGFPFVWQTEISLMYSQDGKGRRIHFVILAPGKEVAKQITSFLASKGRLDYDGRPIFGFSAIELVDEMNRIDKRIEIIPSHIWTPYFGIFGSKSGFNSLKEAFHEKAEKIHAIETGMSSSPDMNWRIKELHDKSIISFSDSHSFWPWRIGREATVFNSVNSYNDLLEQIRENTFLATIETDPGYGIYHWDGHKDCNFSSPPSKTKELNSICPVCNKNLTIGVDNRVNELAEFPDGFRSRNAKPFYKILPLHELIALGRASTLASKKTWETYNKLIDKFGNELKILIETDKKDLAGFLANDTLLVELIMKNRIGDIKVKPGYDGKYGEPILSEKQVKLF
jgi:uncharacterized protein (TIGR00375 family)